MPKKQSPTNVRSAKVLAIPHKRILELFSYDPEIGKLRWKLKAAPKVVVGTVAGQQKPDGYWYVGFDGVRLPLHHVIWFYHYGSWPTEYLGFKNGDRTNTYVENLKLVLASDKQKLDALQHFALSAEQQAIKHNVSGKYWRVRYKGVKLGKFLTYAAAKEAYDKAVAGELDLEEQKEVNAKLSLLRLRAPWRMLLKSGVEHGWNSFAHFVETVKDRPGKLLKLCAVKLSEPIGPSNFMWEEPTPAKSFARRSAESTEAADKERAKWIKRKFGVAADWFPNTYREQGGVCAVCGKPETAVRKGKLLPLSIDHDHVTGRTRGLLCSACNIGIGCLQDTPELIRKAADYVEQWRAKHEETANVIPIRVLPSTP